MSIKGHTKGVWVAVSPITIKFEERLYNVYEGICEAEQLGRVHVVRYQTLFPDSWKLAEEVK